MNLLCRITHATPLSTTKYPLNTASAVESLAYIVFIETFIKPVNRFA
jgi:hypothetical protein